MNSRCYRCGLDLDVPVNRQFCPVHRKERELARRLKAVMAWKAMNRNPLPECDPSHAPPPVYLDAYQLAALHKKLVAAFRYEDANKVLDRLHELAARPIDPPAEDHPLPTSFSTQQ